MVLKKWESKSLKARRATRIVWMVVKGSGFKTFNISPFSTLSSDLLTYFIALSQNSTPVRGQRGQNGIAALKLLIWAKVFEAR